MPTAGSQDQRGATVAIVLSSVVAIAVGALLAFLFARRLVAGLRQLTGLSASYAAGDFTRVATIDSKDELRDLAEAFHGMARTLGKVIGDVRTAAGQVDTSAKAIDGATHQLSQGSQQHAASVEEISASLQQISTGIDASAKDIAEANTLADLEALLGEPAS